MKTLATNIYYVYFGPVAPVGFLIVPPGADPTDPADTRTVLAQFDWEYPGVATAMGWQACPCGGTDGTVDCAACGRTRSVMISEAYDHIRALEGESFPALADYFQGKD